MQFNNLSKIIISIVILALYALAGWHQRGWVDWMGLATVALLAVPVTAFMPERRKK